MLNLLKTISQGAPTQDVTATQGHPNTSLFSISILHPTISLQHTSQNQHFSMRKRQQKNGHPSSCNLYYHALVTALTVGKKTYQLQYLPVQIHPFRLENIVQTLSHMLPIKVFMTQVMPVQFEVISSDLSFSQVQSKSRLALLQAMGV